MTPEILVLLIISHINYSMYNSRIAGMGAYVPENIVTNDDLSKIMDTNDAWIQI